MSNTILVTDSLFINDKHIKQLESAGFAVERLDKPEATEDELCQAVKGKVGYILGGVEKVTEKVIDSGDELKAIVFTGTGWDGFITAHDYASKKGILIGAAPHMNAHAVAEFGMTMSLIMARDAIAIARGNEKTFETTRSLSELKIGILGLGHIGQDYLKMARGMGVTELYYANRTRKVDIENAHGIKYLEKTDLLKTCDLIFVALSVRPGNEYINSDDIESMRQDAILVSIADPLLFDLDALYKALASGKIRGAFDENIEEERFEKLSLSAWYTPNVSSAFNTGQTIEDVSSSCVSTMINLLTAGKDKHRMN